jgi:signal transduction histidine kinase
MTASPTDDLAPPERRIRELTKELSEAREQQATTAEILRVISSSPTDSRRVFTEIAASASRVCDAYDATVYRLDGDFLHPIAHYGGIPQGGALPLTRGFIAVRVILDRQTVHIADMQAQTDEFPEGSDVARRLGFRTILAVPLIRAGAAIGVIAVRRSEVKLFSDRQVALLKTFADQAVIAIENTRLFEAEQASKRELQESLEYQTAISEVLSVISRSPNDLNPVLKAIGEIAGRLCAANDVSILLRRGDKLRLMFVSGPIGGDPEGHDFALTRGYVMGRAVIDAKPVQVGDLQVESDEFPEGSANAAKLGHRTILAVPLLQADQAIGTIVLRRLEVDPFSPNQIALLQTFADQAVIAIENTRLFEEVQARTRELAESLEYQTATSEVLSVVSRSAFELQPVLEAVVESATRLCGATRGHIFRFEGEYLRFAAAHGAWPGFTEYLETHPIRPGRSGASERAALERQTVHISDVLLDPDYQQLDLVKRQGYRTVLAVPMIREGTLLGVIAVLKTHVDPFTDKQIALVETFADQAVIAIENARLFEEVQARTRELAKTVEDLEIASQHKNQFVANMSHELRTPLAAILGYAELIQEGFYEPQGPKSLDALTRIRSNGKHLLGLINTVLDIAKIESGQFTLTMSEYAIESVVETVRAATESLAQNKKLTLTTSVDKSLPIGLGDEQRLTQVLLNLVGNAIKFTDAGEVSIAAGARNGNFSVSVTDTGPGIPLDQQGRIFEQFHQVDSSNTKAKGGTGLGLAIAKQIVEMHGGRIWVVSTPGKGSTFQMELPTRAQFHKKTP